MVQMDATVLIVDDRDDNIRQLRGLLEDKYRIKVAKSGTDALELSCTRPPDLILMDAVPGAFDGYEVCRRLKNEEQLWNVPVVFLSSCSDSGRKKEAFAAGAMDYITRPVETEALRSRVKTHITLKRARDLTKNQSAANWSEWAGLGENRETVRDINALAVAILSEKKTNGSCSHIVRTQLYMQQLLDRLKQKPKFKEILTDENIGLMVRAAPLHDIGKMGVPDDILLKPGPLSKKERDVVKAHTIFGYNAVLRAEGQQSKPDAVFQFAKEIVYSHHERWDGTGYPQKLSGESIPLSARIMSIVDVYDALTSKRTYKRALSHELATRIIKTESGKHFDADIVDAFLTIEDIFKAISERHKKE